MIYRSNISAPDLAPYFAATTICKPRPWSMGHDVLSDKDFEPDNTFMTHDEAALLYECARKSTGLWPWLDIGCRTGWTSAHIAASGHVVYAVDPALADHDFMSRFELNTGEWDVRPRADFSDGFFEYCYEWPFSGVCIDGNHDSPYPLNDARNALAHLAETGVIVLHDFWGRPIREGVEYLMQQWLKCRIYDTPNGMAVCWRGDFEPPDHVPDPRIDWVSVRRGRAPEFDFSKCQ